MAMRHDPLNKPTLLSRTIDGLRPYRTFLNGFIRNPTMVGSGIPSAPWMVQRLIDRVDWSRMRTIVEYGPGIGSFTRAALARMRPDAKLVAIDTSRDFVRHLTISIEDRLRAVAGSAIDVRRILSDRGLPQADCVISGLPFSTLPYDTGEMIVRETARTLKDDGSFLVYQMSSAVRPMLGRTFGAIHEEREWLNIPPCRLYHASRPLHRAGRAGQARADARLSES